MDVLSSEPPAYRLFRRRIHVQTPEINTYQRQILFCEKKCDTISKKFSIPDAHPTSVEGRQTRECPVADGYTNGNTTIPRSSRNNSIHNYNNNTGFRRGSSTLHLKSGPASKRPSIALPAKRSSFSKSISRRYSSEANAALIGSTRNGVNRSNTIYSSRRESGMVDNAQDVVKDKHGEERQPSHSFHKQDNVNSSPGAFEELNNVLYRERERFLRALTTLAINRMTTDSTYVPPVERHSTFTDYERNIEVLADGSQRVFGADDQVIIMPTLPTTGPGNGDVDYCNDHHNDDVSTVSSSATSELYGVLADDENTVLRHVDKRQRINQLRNYLRCSGVGDPNVITTVKEQTEDEKQAFGRLIRRINRGLSCEKQERLRRKARLDYEMSLMKGESFCEQQQQAYMRTASADMENRDVQLLEEELKIHALEEIRHNNNNQTSHAKDHETSRRRLSLGKKQTTSSPDVYQQQQQQKGCYSNGNHGRGDNPNEKTSASAAEETTTLEVDYDDKTSISEERDAMSGLIRNPLSRQEMRKRILLWVYDVEEATRMYSQVDNNNISRHNTPQRRI